MKKLFFALILGFLSCAPVWAATYILTGDSVAIIDQTIDKTHYEVKIFTHRQSDVYEVYLDLWPKTASVIGSFSALEGSIEYYFSGLIKNNKTDYYCADNSRIELSITRIDEDSCEISAYVQAARWDDPYTLYSYQINTFRFAYKSGDMPPDPTEDPYRFEPEQTVDQSFSGQIVTVRDHRETTGWINFNLSDSINQKWDWIELDLVADSFAMPVGTFTFSADSTPGTFIASPGYRNKNDYPSYVALRGEEWGQYDPYYIQTGSLTFSLNEKGDTVYIKGSVTSQHGSTFAVDVTAYNMFYYNPIPPKPKEEKELTIDSVSIVYLRNESDTTAMWHEYTFDFSYQQDFPNVLFNVYMSAPGKLVEGTYSMANDSLDGPLLFQNQSEYNDFFQEGINYAFNAVSLTLTDIGNDVWEFQVDMRDTVGSHYYFTLRQKPNIDIYPEIDPTPEEDKPYVAESKEPTIQNVTFKTVIWDDSSMNTDGIIEIQLFEGQYQDGWQTAADLGMLVSKDVVPGTYPVKGTDETETFMASIGQLYNFNFPSYWCTLNSSMIMKDIWYITSGEITITGNAQSGRSIEGTVYSYFGSSLTFKYMSAGTGLDSVKEGHQAVKLLRNGHIIIMHNGKQYSL